MDLNFWLGVLGGVLSNGLCWVFGQWRVGSRWLGVALVVTSALFLQLGNLCLSWGVPYCCLA